MSGSGQLFLPFSIDFGSFVRTSHLDLHVLAIEERQQTRHSLLLTWGSARLPCVFTGWFIPKSKLTFREKGSGFRPFSANPILAQQYSGGQGDVTSFYSQQVLSPAFKVRL